jgi:hypothetical protein
MAESSLSDKAFRIGGKNLRVDQGTGIEVMVIVG